MYFLVTFKEVDMYHLLQYPLLKDQGMDEPNMEYETPEIPRPRKRKHSARLVSVTQRAILSEVGADINVQILLEHYVPYLSSSC